MEKRGREVFVDYFKTNWENCKEKWVKYHRMDCLHIGNNTNNRLESAWGKLKLELKRNTPIDEAVGEILVTQVMREEEWEVQMLKGELIFIITSSFINLINILIKYINLTNIFIKKVNSNSTIITSMMRR
jgi:hypothetical protein